MPRQLLWFLLHILSLLSIRARAFCHGSLAIGRRQRQVQLLFSAETGQQAQDKDVVGIPYDDDLVYMGITQELDELPTGDSLSKQLLFSIGSATPSPRTISIQKVSQRPPLFILKNVLTPTECQQVQEWASSQTMGQAETLVDGDYTYRKNSRMTWLSNQRYPGLLDLAQQIQSIFLPYEPAGKGVEDFQVVHYTPSGEYKFHHDGEQRLLTTLYYLNGVSETWFPLADYQDAKGQPRRITSHPEAMTVAHGMDPDRNGVLATGLQAGDAICFYNYFADASFEWSALHAGLPAQSDKWIATQWYHHVRRQPQQ